MTKLNIKPTIEESIKLANLWTSLQSCQEKLDNDIIPVASYLGVEDSELLTALETLSEAINNHFEKFRLIAVGTSQTRL